MHACMHAHTHPCTHTHMDTYTHTHLSWPACSSYPQYTGVPPQPPLPGHPAAWQSPRDVAHLTHSWSACLLDQIRSNQTRSEQIRADQTSCVSLCVSALLMVSEVHVDVTFALLLTRTTIIMRFIDWY